MNVNRRWRYVIQVFVLFLAVFELGSCLNLNAISGEVFITEISPGEKLFHQIVVNNSREDGLTNVTASVNGHGMGLDGARTPIDVDREMLPYSAASFLKITPESAILNQGEPVVFTLEGTVPVDVGSGGKYALASIITEPSGDDWVGVRIEQIVPVLLTISGTDLIETGEITDMTISDEIVNVTFKNTGNYHFKASSEAVIKDNNGDVVATASAPIMYTSLVPPASWLFSMKIDAERDLVPGTYTVEAKVNKENMSLLDSKEMEFEI